MSDQVELLIQLGCEFLKVSCVAVSMISIYVSLSNFAVNFGKLYIYKYKYQILAHAIAFARSRFLLSDFKDFY